MPLWVKQRYSFHRLRHMTCIQKRHYIAGVFIIPASWVEKGDAKTSCKHGAACSKDGESTNDCGEEQTMKHLLVRPLLPEPCNPKDIGGFNTKASSCLRHWSAYKRDTILQVFSLSLRHGWNRAVQSAHVNMGLLIANMEKVRTTVGRNRP